MISVSYRSPLSTARTVAGGRGGPGPGSDCPTAPPPHPTVPPPAYSSLKREREDQTEDVTILCRCPRTESYMWMVSLYSTVCGGCGSILALLWLVGHLYVLLETQDSELKTQRWGLACYHC